MPKLTVAYDKTLKLTNVVMTELALGSMDTIITLTKMENYIKSKNAQLIGPAIQHTTILKNSSDEIDIMVILMQQATNLIENVEKPFKIEPLIRIPNCLYARYCGPSEKIKFAYEKLAVVAFEEDIPLKGDTYTVFLNEEDGQITADIFMERENG